MWFPFSEGSYVDWPIFPSAVLCPFEWHLLALLSQHSASQELKKKQTLQRLYRLAQNHITSCM